MLTKTIKDFARAAFPGSYQRSEAEITRSRLRTVTRALQRKYGQVIQSGPFQGMKYVSEAVCSSRAPKLLGSYEAELHEALNQIIKTEYQTVIDVGCAEGYYAIGLALRLPRTSVFAFDIDERARTLCTLLAMENNVADRISVQGECDHEKLHELIQGRTLIVCDCEGCELGLLDPVLVPNLRRSDLLVELHDMVDARISETIVSRFTGTHEVTLIDSVERNPTDFPALKDFNEASQRTAVAEFRDTTMQWAYMLAR